MRARFLLAGIFVFGGGSFACSSTGDSGQCPVTTITLDAGVDGLPEVGEYAVGKTCESLCGAGLVVCRRVKDLVLTCQPGCS